MSRLEQFIEEHRDAFDDVNPPEKLWKHVESAVNKNSSKRMIWHLPSGWVAAASVLLVASAGLMLFLNKKTVTQTSTLQPGDSAVSNLAAVAPEAVSEVAQFTRLIAGKQEELKSLAKEQPELYRKFSRDINILDSSYKNLKQKLAQTPSQERLIDAMIQNLQLQLSILNQQLNIIREIKQTKKNNYEAKSYT